ncbi:MAG: hypothetical protein NDI94_05570 [Candidatus Woesearchaeota archaeon]|nr:hypothetical protein [Candidatus Woesearchaeota archaeon]
MKKSQVTIFIVFGLLMLFIIGYFLSTVMDLSNKKHMADSERIISLSDVNTDSKGYINYCINDASQKAIEEVGIRQDTLELFKLITERNMRLCTKSLFDELKEQGYNISEGKIAIKVELSEQTVIVNVNYPIIIERDGPKVEFSEFYYVFDRSITRNIPQGFSQEEIKIISADRKAQLIIPKGTRVIDRDGSAVETIGTRVEDVHFDGLENKYVLGQIVYDNFPDGARFSEPVEFSIKFDEKDIPAGYTKDSLMISYWDETDGFWHAVPTQIVDDVAIAKIEHFSDWSLNLLRPYAIEQTIGRNRFTPFTASTGSSVDKSYWKIGGDADDEGTVTIQVTDYEGNIPSDISLLYETAGNRYEDFKETMKFLETQYLPAPPNLQYGYFKEDSFIPCEPDAGTANQLEGYGITYFTIKGTGFSHGVEVDYPYFYICNDKSRKNDYCTCANDEECECDTVNVGFPIGIDKWCINTGSITGPNQYECTIETTESAEAFCENVAQFGYHNLQCSSFYVTPEGTGEEASFFIAFEPNGNAVIDQIPGFDIVYEKPSQEKNFLDPLKDYPFYTEIIPYENGEKTKSFFLSENSITSLFSEAQNNPRVPAIGINKAKVTKELPNKDTLHTEGQAVWIFKGNGYLRASTPPELTKEYSDPEQLYSKFADFVAITRKKIDNTLEDYLP